MSTFFSAEPQPSEARDVARILLETLYDLKDIRSVIRDKNDEVAVILQRTEGALRAKAQQLTGAEAMRALPTDSTLCLSSPPSQSAQTSLLITSLCSCPGKAGDAPLPRRARRIKRAVRPGDALAHGHGEGPRLQAQGPRARPGCLVPSPPPPAAPRGAHTTAAL